MIYTAITSLDGFIADEQGRFDWAEPDGEVHSFINDQVRPVGTYLYGRRMYETMVAWESLYAAPDLPPILADFAHIWHDAEKIVYSRSLEHLSSARTRIDRHFEPDAIRLMKTNAERDLAVGGAILAAEALKAGLVDEIDLFVTPVVIGGGNHWLPRRLHLNLELLEEHRFRSGTIHLRYRIKPKFQTT